MTTSSVKNPKKTLKKAPTSSEKDDSLEGDIASRITPVAKITKPYKMVVYGRSGTGKTTFAASFPTPSLLIDCNDRGTDSVVDVKGLEVLPARNMTDIDQVYWLLEANKRGYKTVIIDTVSMLQEFATKEVLIEDGKDEEKAGQWGSMTKRHWGEVSSKLKSIIHRFRDLEMHVIFIAQDRTFSGEGEEGEEGQIAPEVGPRLMPSVASVMNAAVDFIGNTFVREQISTIKIGTKKKTKSKIQYSMRIGPHASYITKVRKPKGVEVPRYIVDPTFQKLEQLKKGE